MRLLLLTILAIFLEGGVMAQSIPAERLTDWRTAGAVTEELMASRIVDFGEWGGVGDGLAPNDSVFMEVIGMMERPLRIHFPAGSFRFNRKLELPDSVILSGEGPDRTRLLFDLRQQEHAISVAGFAEKALLPLSLDANRFDEQISLSGKPDFAPGTYLYICENDSRLVTSQWAEKSTGQYLRVVAVNDSTVTLDQALRRSFRTAYGAYAQVIHPTRGVTIRDIAIERLDPTDQQTSNVHFNYAVDCRVRCITSANCNFSHVEIARSSHITVEGSYFYDAFDFGGGGKAYGVMLHFGSGGCLVTNNIFERLRHSMILQAGANGNVISYNYSIDPYWTGVALPANSAGDLVLHGNYPFGNLFEGNICQNIVIDDSHGINGPHNFVFRNRAELYGLFMNAGAPTDSVVIVGNEIPNDGLFLGNYITAGKGHFEYGNRHRGRVVPPGSNGVPVASLYLDTVPGFYSGQGLWPPIGAPRLPSEGTIEAELRLDLGVLVGCGFSRPNNTLQYRPQQRISLVPNPANSWVSVTGPGEIIPHSVQVYDLQGRSIICPRHDQMLDVRHLAPGVYILFVKITSRQYASTLLNVVPSH